LPFVYGERLKAEVDHWQEYGGFDDDARAKVERNNAIRLFPRLAECSNESR
jgi:hypothetical protein